MNVRRTILAVLLSLRVQAALAGAASENCWSDPDDEAIKRAQTFPAVQLEPGLPAEPFRDWFEREIAAVAQICWETNDCGEQTGDPAIDREHDLPLCVEARATRGGDSDFGAVLVVGKLATGVADTPPVVFFIYTKVDGEAKRVKSLQELARLAQSTTLSPRNESPIAFQTIDGLWGPSHFCWQSDWGDVPLRGGPMYEADLVRGTPCVVADFDGNSYMDFALQGYGIPNIRPARATRVIFYEKNKAIHTIDIAHGGFQLYPATPTEGEFGEPASKLDGLIIPGEGGSTFVWLFDVETSTFKRSEHASEHH